MRIAGVVGLSLVMGFGFVACASGGGGTLSDAGSVGTVKDGSPDAERDATSSRDSSTKADAFVTATDAKGTDALQTACVLNCKTDNECQTTCPAAPNGNANCCDEQSGVCYVSSSGSCGVVDAGVD